MMERVYQILGQKGMMRRFYYIAGDVSTTTAVWKTERTTMRIVTLLALLMLAIGSTGCVYRANISQGNLIKQEDLDQVALDMTRGQVRYLLGTPMVDDPFHADRWDYVYYLTIGREDASFKRWVTVVFEDDTVTEIRRDQELAPDL